MKKDDQVEKILDESEKICERLNLALMERCKKNQGLDIQTGFYAVARFAAEFLHDVQPILGEDISVAFSETVNNIMQAFKNEGEDDTHRILRFNIGNDEVES